MEALLAIVVGTLTLIGLAICIVKPKYAIVPALMFFPAEQILMGYVPAFRWQYGWVMNLAVGLVALFGVVHHFFRKERIFEGALHKVFYAILALYIYMMITMLWTPSPDSAEHFLKKSWAYFFLFFLVAPLLVRDLEDLKSLCVPLMVTGIAVMGLMLINPNAKFINDRFSIDLGYQVGFGQIQSNPLAIADAGGILAIIAALYRRNEPSALLTMLKWTGVLLGLALALLSGSRGQVLASVAIIAIALPFATGSRSAVKAAGSMALVGVMVGFLYVVFSNFVIGAGQDRWSGQGSSGIGERLEMIKTIMTAYFENPGQWLIGLGAGSFNAFYLFRTSAFPHWYPHNIIVESLTEYGVIGLTLVLVILYFSFRAAFRLIVLAGEDRARRTTAVIFAALILFQFMMSMKQGYLLGMPPLFMFCLIVLRVTYFEEKRHAEMLADEYANPGELEEGAVAEEDDGRGVTGAYPGVA
ncbi:MAG TPA: O-antigen ligase family protein [Phycisphaerales bacterium]|nr:O-antigen ligase family protein [Phycisphaerales bacterium]